MNILLLGTGFQGKAALYDLAQSELVSKVVAIDKNPANISHLLNNINNSKVSVVQQDLNDEPAIKKYMKEADAVICLLTVPISLQTKLVQQAIDCNTHWIDASYLKPEIKNLEQLAIEKNISIIPESGLDPGIDLVLTGRIIQELDEIAELYTYGCGLPAPDCLDNPLNYKISWSFSGVLNAYKRAATVVTDSCITAIPPGEVFSQKNRHLVKMRNIGNLEAYPNGDVTSYLEHCGLSKSIVEAARYTMRYPGHCDFWEKMYLLGFLSEEVTPIGASEVVPITFVHDLLEPQLHYQLDERDLVAVRVDARGKVDGKDKTIIYDLIDYRDLNTGFLAMQRTVGFTASIVCQMKLKGEISKTGIVSPVTEIPYQSFVKELAKRNLYITRKVQ